MQSNRAAVELGERLVGRAGADHADVSAPDQLHHRLALTLVVLDDEHRARAPVEELAELLEDLAQPFGRERLGREADRARGARLMRALPSATTYTGMWRVWGWRFRWSSTASPSTCGSSRLTTIASGMNSCTSASPASPRSASRHLKSCSCATPTAERASSGPRS